MDAKQFDRLQRGVQWVVDEQRYLREHDWDIADKSDHLFHRQASWAAGVITSTVRRLRGDRLIRDDEQWGGLSDKVHHVVCPSSCCLAGNIVSAEGDEFVVSGWAPGLHTSRVSYCIDTEGNLHGIGSRARALAGLNLTEANALFNENNTPHDIVAKARFIASEHGYQLEVL